MSSKATKITIAVLLLGNATFCQSDIGLSSFHRVTATTQCGKPDLR